MSQELVYMRRMVCVIVQPSPALLLDYFFGIVLGFKHCSGFRQADARD